jgi:hypothetical protein
MEFTYLQGIHASSIFHFITSVDKQVLKRIYFLGTRRREFRIASHSLLAGLQNMEIISKQEGNFAKVIVLPLYNVLAEFAGPDFKEIARNCENNI